MKIRYGDKYYRRIGKCNQCGKCCELFQYSFQSRNDHTGKYYLYRNIHKMHFCTIRPFDKDKYVFRCYAYSLKLKRCLRYDNRTPICSKFLWSPEIPLPVSCGFSWELLSRRKEGVK